MDYRLPPNLMHNAVSSKLPAFAPKVPISVFILTYNEEANLDACLSSLIDYAGEVFIVDSFSKDGTVNIATQYGAHVIQHAFQGFGAQRNWALKSIPFSYEWIMALDADHRVTPELWAELGAILRGTKPEIAGFFVKRRQVFRGRWIKHGGYYPKYMLKIFRKGAAIFDEDENDDRAYVQGETRNLKCDIVESNANELSIGMWIEKHNRYASCLAEEEIRIRHGEKKFLINPILFGNPNQRVHWLKMRWYRMPLYIRPILYFLYRYGLRLGFLDGKEGFIFHFLQAFWFRLLVDIKIEELLGTTSLGSVQK